MTTVIVFSVVSPGLSSLVCVAAATSLLAGCGSDRPGAPAGAPGAQAPDCPAAPVDVVVSVDQWGDIVTQLAGSCAQVTTVLASSSVDPHDYEPSPANAASFAGAELIVVNGAGYDRWASDLAATSAPAARVVSAAAVTRTPDGANPHLWYDPTAVTEVADAITAELSAISPTAADYFTARRGDFAAALTPYSALIEKIRSGAAGKTYAATESVFDYQARALGLVDKTPEGFKRSAANDSEPTPGDIAAFRQALADKRIDVLIYNIQTEGSIPGRIRAAAEENGIPVVEVTETVAPGETSFVGWQDEQLVALAGALGVGP